MSLFNYLLISVLLLGFQAPAELNFPSGDCPSIQIDYTLNQPQFGQFDLTVNPKGGKAPYKIVLSEESGNLVSEDFTQTIFRKLEQGKYICVVVDSNKCMSKTEINVQP